MERKRLILVGVFVLSVLLLVLGVGYSLSILKKNQIFEKKAENNSGYEIAEILQKDEVFAPALNYDYLFGEFPLTGNEINAFTFTCFVEEVNSDNYIEITDTLTASFTTDCSFLDKDNNKQTVTVVMGASLLQENKLYTWAIGERIKRDRSEFLPDGNILKLILEQNAAIKNGGYDPVETWENNPSADKPNFGKKDILEIMVAYPENELIQKKHLDSTSALSELVYENWIKEIGKEPLEKFINSGNISSLPKYNGKTFIPAMRVFYEQDN